MVPIRRLTVSNPPLSPARAANSSAVFLNTGIWCAATTGSGASSRHGSSSTPAYTAMPLATENRRTLDRREQPAGLGPPLPRHGAGLPDVEELLDDLAVCVDERMRPGELPVPRGRRILLVFSRDPSQEGEPLGHLDGLRQHLLVP